MCVKMTISLQNKTCKNNNKKQLSNLKQCGQSLGTIDKLLYNMSSHQHTSSNFSTGSRRRISNLAPYQDPLKEATDFREKDKYNSVNDMYFILNTRQNLFSINQSAKQPAADNKETDRARLHTRTRVTY